MNVQLGKGLATFEKLLDSAKELLRRRVLMDRNGGDAKIGYDVPFEQTTPPEGQGTVGLTRTSS
jgi:hypothetical protein